MCFVHFLVLFEHLFVVCLLVCFCACLGIACSLFVSCAFVGVCVLFRLSKQTSALLVLMLVCACLKLLCSSQFACVVCVGLLFGCWFAFVCFCYVVCD